MTVLVVPAAGFGKRMKPVNPELPKELLPLGGIPVIYYTLKEAFEAGIKDVVLVIGPHKEILRRYIENPEVRRSLTRNHEEVTTVIESLRFHFLYQMKPTGEADAIALARPLTGDNPVAVVYPDNIHIPPGKALRKILSVFEQYGKDVVGLTEVTEQLQRATGNAGRVNLKRFREGTYQIMEFLPKGPGWFGLRFKGELRTCGFSIVGPHLYEYIERARAMHREGEFIDLYYKGLLVSERTILGVPLPGVVYDVGNPEGYRLCNMELSQSF